jgi:molybdopterin synthase catalytic subunit
MSETISVHVRAFAALREALGTGQLALRLAPGTDVAGLLAHLNAAYPAARLSDRRLAVAVNREYAPLDRPLEDQDEIALIPPVSGGALDASHGKLFEITDQTLSVDDVIARVAGPERGGITVFAGTVRGLTEQLPGAPLHDPVHTDYLEYEAYPEMAERELASIGAEARARWPAISAVAIVHRTGRLEVGDLAVVIAVAAGHRRDTFDACHYIIDRVKEIAPIWKREVGPDGSSWVEGPESSV